MNSMDGFPEGMRQSAISARYRWTSLEILEVDEAIGRIAATGEPFTTDRVWEILGADFPVTKGMAARLNSAARRGVIRSTGRTETSRRRGEHDHGQRLTVWIGTDLAEAYQEAVTAVGAGTAGTPACPIHGSTCRKVWHKAQDRPQPTQSTDTPDLVRVEREGKGDAYISRKRAMEQSASATRDAQVADRIAIQKATPRVDPSTHRLSFGGPMPCDKCGGTGGTLWEACFACGGTGLR